MPETQVKQNSCGISDAEMADISRTFEKVFGIGNIAEQGKIFRRVLLLRNKPRSHIEDHLHQIALRARAHNNPRKITNRSPAEMDAWNKYISKSSFPLYPNYSKISRQAYAEIWLVIVLWPYDHIDLLNNTEKLWREFSAENSLEDSLFIFVMLALSEKYCENVRSSECFAGRVRGLFYHGESGHNNRALMCEWLCQLKNSQLPAQQRARLACVMVQFFDTDRLPYNFRANVGYLLQSITSLATADRSAGEILGNALVEKVSSIAYGRCFVGNEENLSLVVQYCCRNNNTFSPKHYTEILHSLLYYCSQCADRKKSTDTIKLLFEISEVAIHFINDETIEVGFREKVAHAYFLCRRAIESCETGNGKKTGARPENKVKDLHFLELMRYG